MRVSTALAIAVLAATSFFSSGAGAQQDAIVAPGDAVVTAFSGVPYPPSGERIDRDGPSLRVISLPGGGAFGLTGAQKIFTAKAGDIGQVFGVALDNKPSPNVFASATAAYGLAIYRPGHGRLRNGAPGAQYTPGQFGPAEQGGGPDSIWRIDGVTGDITLFANVSFNGIQNTPASLGALAFDGNTQQLFVSDRATGMIHRFGMDGTDRGVFDHGVQGRQSAGMPPVPFNPSTLANIQSGNFDAQNPRSWGFAPSERRVFALAMHYGRLYYSVAANSEVWSVGIARDGSFANDARYETSAPALRPGVEISQIAFDGRGWMYVAERGVPTGAPDFVAVADSGHERVLRFMPKQPNDPSRGYWHLQPDEYAIGMLPDFQNADGGVGLTCGRTVWSTGDRLLDPGNARPGSFPAIDGLQGNDSNLVKPQNMPPLKSWMVNYYDQQSDIASRGHMGSLAIRNVCGGAPPPPSGGGYIGFSCPPGMFAVDGQCFLPPMCPPDTIWRNGYCIYPRCPFGLVDIRGECRRPPVICHRDEVYVRDRCVPVGCPPALMRDGRGYCGCPRGEEYRDGRCVPPCQDQLRDRNGRCVPPCPRDQIRDRDGRCVPPCQPGITAIGNCPCPQGEVRNSDHRCVPPPCPQGEVRNSDGRCVPPPCPQGEVRNSDGRCVPPPSNNCPPGITALPNCPCPRGEVRNSDGRCVVPHHTTHCPRGESWNGRHCVASNNNGGGTLVTVVRKPKGDGGCSNAERDRDGNCGSSGGTNNHSTGLGCSREEYDRYGHCPGSNGNSNNGNNGDHKYHHPRFSNGENGSDGGYNGAGDGSKNGVSNNHSTGLGCSRAEYDRLGHCPASGDSNGNTYKYRHIRSNGGNGDNDQNGGNTNDRSNNERDKKYPPQNDPQDYHDNSGR